MPRPDDLVLAALTRDARPAMRFRYLLDSTWIGFRAAYNGRDDRWTLDMRQDDGTPIVLGLRLVVGHDLLRCLRHLAVPPGQLYVADLAGQHRDPDRRGFASYARLLYRPASVVELAAGTDGEVLA